jgi:hypothetical protein
MKWKRTETYTNAAEAIGLWKIKSKRPLIKKSPVCTHVRKGKDEDR